MIDNVGVGRIVYLDYDVEFGPFYRLESTIAEKVIGRIDEIHGLTGLYVEDVSIRPSGRGNVHLRITFDHVVTMLECYCIRAYMKEDIFRLMLDMARYCRTRDAKQCNLIWDTKYKDGKLYKAGEWQKWDYSGIMSAKKRLESSSE